MSVNSCKLRSRDQGIFQFVLLERFPFEFPLNSFATRQGFDCHLAIIMNLSIKRGLSLGKIEGFYEVVFATEILSSPSLVYLALQINDLFLAIICLKKMDSKLPIDLYLVDLLREKLLDSFRKGLINMTDLKLMELILENHPYQIVILGVKDYLTFLSKK
ncbi:MAG TPA: hypothetical protein P5048_02515 [Chlamydiales bacterium]|nr:hypothetical protein [Chlamydiales bacterium]